MSETRKLDLVWIGLVLLSLVGARLGGPGDAGLSVTVMVALVMGIKVRLVCDYFLEMPTAHHRIRIAMYLFCYGMPILVILTTIFGDFLARITGALI